MASVNLSSANSKFALNIYKHFPEDEKNLFFSPSSISIALAMTYLGAGGNTAKEMSTVLNFGDLKTDDFHSSFHALLSALKSPDENIHKLLLANRLFAEKTYNFVETFLQDTKKFYSAELAKVDFRHQLEAARKEINKWVEDETAQKIKELFPPDVLTNQTRLVLVSAIYFKGKWAMPFSPHTTRDEPFKTGSNNQVSVPMMPLQKIFNYGHCDQLGCSVLELPYLDHILSMFIFLPSEIEGLQSLQGKLTTAHLIDTENMFKMSFEDVIVKIPKFRLEQTFDLVEILSKMGIHDLFTPGKADLSAMDSSKSLFVSKVVHKTFVEVNEEGTEAAAATAVVAMLGCSRSMKKPAEFIADHPFIFLIRENTTKSILFLGRLSNPVKI